MVKQSPGFSTITILIAVLTIVGLSFHNLLFGLCGGCIFFMLDEFCAAIQNIGGRL